MTLAAERTRDVFWAPFKSDCEELLGRFQQTGSVRFEDFAALWKVMDFASVFYDMPTINEKRRFIRLVFATVYEYFLPPYNFQIKVGALYTLYGLYFTQPVWPKEGIWIALKDWKSIQMFVSDALGCQHLDVVYVYKKLVSEKAFVHAAMPSELTFDAKHRFKNKNVNETFQDQPSKVTELVNEGTLEEINNVHSHYERIKQALNVSASVSVTPVNLTKQLQECALGFQQWRKNNKKQRNENSKAEKESTQPTEASKSRRHRQVEMDTSASGTDTTQEALSPQRKKQPSLRARTCRMMGYKGKRAPRQQLSWLLTLREEDAEALRRCPQKKTFKW